MIKGAAVRTRSRRPVMTVRTARQQVRVSAKIKRLWLWLVRRCELKVERSLDLPFRPHPPSAGVGLFSASRMSACPKAFNESCYYYIDAVILTSLTRTPNSAV